MLECRLIVFLLSLLLSAHSWADAVSTDKGAQPQIFSQWLKIYQFHKGHSRIDSQRFFFAEDGATNPQAELIAALSAFWDTEKLYGTLNLPAACAFPARKEVLEKQFHISFPKIKCPDLDEWLSRIDANRMSINFAGAYSGNPASILGHTFFRFYSDAKKRDGSELLSYAVGFLAVAPPKESRALYMVKGLTGQYPGFFQIEPYYMKVGIYNNSESRDIWEQQLNLTKEEVAFSLKLLWEYTFNAQIPYYFIDENCSYRLLSFLEAVRPNAELVGKLSLVVLPADTVRVLLDQGLADPNPQFRASILRRLNARIAKFSSKQKRNFDQAKTSLEFTKNLTDVFVLDALIDYWTYANYRVQTNLENKKSEMMEAAFLKRSQIQEKGLIIDDHQLQQEQNLLPTYQGHKTSWASLAGGIFKTHKNTKSYSKLSYRMGAHSLSADPDGYDGIAAIEYLGFDIGSEKDWNLLLVDAKSLELLSSAEKKWSWLADIRIQQMPQDGEPRLALKGGGGGTFGIQSFKVYFMPIARMDFSRRLSEIRAGFEIGGAFHSGRWGVGFFREETWGREKAPWTKDRLQIDFHLTRDHAVIAELQSLVEAQSHQVVLGYQRYF